MSKNVSEEKRVVGFQVQDDGDLDEGDDNGDQER